MSEVEKAVPEVKPAKKSAPVFFKDFGKTVSDILKPSKYVLDKQVEVKAKVKNGVSIIASGTAAEDHLVGKLVVKSNVAKSTDFEGELHSSGKFTGKLISDKLAPGLKITASNESEPSKGSSLHVLESLYARNNIATSLTATSNSGKDYKLDGSVVFGYEGIAVGGQGTYKDSVLLDYNGGAEYSGEDFTVTVKTSNKAEKVSFSYSVAMSPITTVIGSMGYDFGKSTPGNEFSMGGSYKMNDASTLTSVLTTKGAVSYLSALCEHKLDPATQLSVSAIVDLRDVLVPGGVASRSGPGCKFGIKLTFG